MGRSRACRLTCNAWQRPSRTSDDGRAPPGELLHATAELRSHSAARLHAAVCARARVLEASGKTRDASKRGGVAHPIHGAWVRTVVRCVYAIQRERRGSAARMRALTYGLAGQEGHRRDTYISCTQSVCIPATRSCDTSSSNIICSSFLLPSSRPRAPHLGSSRTRA